MARIIIEADELDFDFMCLTHGQTVPMRPKSCEYENDTEPCRYAWVCLTPVNETEAALQAKWTGLADVGGDS